MHFFSPKYLIRIWIVGLLLTPQAFAASKQRDYFTAVQQKLIRDGFDGRYITQLYQNPEVSYELRSVSLYFVYRESTLNYDQFLEPERIAKAKAYMQAHSQDLSKAELAFGVNRRVITAILLVESGLGETIGTRSVFNVLSSIAALYDPDVKDYLWQNLPKDKRLSRNSFDEKAKRKSAWAYLELKALLKFAAREGINPLEIKGSFAGAMGFCQFMPTNVLTLAKDGNGDGRIDLFTHPDAIMSIASYLKHYGWYGAIKPEDAYDVVHKYNPSKYYVNTVLGIVERLRS
jgi:membrane-bound lytic murein transglycosylase B